MPANIITITTDFGSKGPFVGIMKGVMSNINPDVRIVDLCNDIGTQNIFEASLLLSMSYKYFPPGSIHLAVVDPEVGSNRRPILVLTDDHYFIGPDNGIFTHIYRDPHETLQVLHIQADHYFLSTTGATFHGRDIFAPVAGWFSRGIDSSSLGDVITDYTSLTIKEPVKVTKTAMEGEIIYIDTFGNAMTNFTKIHLDDLYSDMPGANLKLICKGNQLNFTNHYAEAPAGIPSVLINSFGYLEMFIYKDNISKKIGLQVSDKVAIMIS